MGFIDLLRKEDYYRGFLELLEQLTTTNSKDINYKDFVRQLKSMHNSIVFVIRNENKVIGTATLVIERKFIHNLSSVGHIEDVVVDTNHRKKGLGKLLVKHLIHISRILNCYKVILDCSSDNISFYEKCGFKSNETQMVKYF